MSKLVQNVFVMCLFVLLFFSTLFAQEVDLPPAVTHVYKTVQGHEISADVYLPDQPGSHPVVLWIHGGGLIFGNRSDIPKYQVSRYLNHGFAVVAIDYRLAPETKLPEIAKDVDDAYEWIRSEGPDLFGADSERIAVVGHSGGGYLALLAGLRVQPPPVAIVSFYGYGTITGRWLEEPSPTYTEMDSLSEEYAMEYVGGPVISHPEGGPEWPDGRARFYIYCRQQGTWPTCITGHDPVSEREWFKQYEPFRSLTSSHPLTMLLHGEADRDVDFEQSEMMVRVLGDKGVEFEFVRNPDWGHMFDYWGEDDQKVLEAFDQVLGFLEKKFSD